MRASAQAKASGSERRIVARVPLAACPPVSLARRHQARADKLPAAPNNATRHPEVDGALATLSDGQRGIEDERMDRLIGLA